MDTNYQIGDKIIWKKISGIVVGSTKLYYDIETNDGVVRIFKKWID